MDEPLTYVLRFVRPAYAGGDPEPPTTGHGLTVTTTIADGTLSSRLTELAGGEATLALTYQQVADTSLFLEQGTLSFGAGSLTFSSIGAGTLLNTPDADGFSHGTIAYLVQSGTGPLEGASGIIASNFRVNLQTNDLVDTHLGIIRLP
jgi:hypothetical protein